jgi:hypothetical protein
VGVRFLLAALRRAVRRVATATAIRSIVAATLAVGLAVVIPAADRALAARPMLTPSAPSGSSGSSGSSTTDAGNGSTTTTSVTSTPAYWLVASDGGIFSFGGTPFYGSMGGQHLNKPIVAMSGSGSNGGYWEVASDGGIFSFGAPFYGSMGGQPLNKPVVGMAVDPATGGYWLVASDGGIFSFGAPFYGSMGGQHLNKPIVGIAPTGDGRGYWLVASDGGIFAFGDAPFHGSTGAMTLNQPIVSMAPDNTTGGYWEVAADGGIFAYDAPYEGSLGGQPIKHPVVAVSSTPDAGGYWLTDNNGAVSAFGDAGYFGSAPQVINQPVVGMSQGMGNGSSSGVAFQSGAYGNDVSNFQCGYSLPGHSIGIVEVVGSSGGKVNPCLSSEAGWAGGGLNLYIYLTNGTATTSANPACGDDESCNWGFNAAQDAFTKAQLTGVNVDVTWWIDVETYAANWSSNLAENAQVVQGAIEGLRDEGLNNVGIYASPSVWNTIVGNYQPAVPYWMADWLSPPSGPASCSDYSAHWSQSAKLPTGPLVIVQYTNAITFSGTTFDGDYAC